MPYIPENTRRHVAEGRPETAGELNYFLTMAVIQYVQDIGLNYQTIADVVSSFECAKLEFARRVVAPYEDKKIAENGDVYPASLTGESR